MKNIFLIFTVLFSVELFAQTPPDGINYQAVARDASGVEMSETIIDVKMIIKSGGTDGDNIWTEKHEVTTNEFGLFSLVIGAGISTGEGSASVFGDIDWSLAPHYLNVEIDYGDGYIDMGTEQFMSVPYAFASGDSQKLWDTNGSNTWLIDTTSEVGIGTYFPRGGLEIKRDYDIGYNSMLGSFTTNGHLNLIDDGGCSTSSTGGGGGFPDLSLDTLIFNPDDLVSPMTLNSISTTPFDPVDDISVGMVGPAEDFRSWITFGNTISAGKWLMGARPSSYCDGSQSSTSYLPDFKLQYFNEQSLEDILHITHNFSTKLSIGTSSPLSNLHVMGGSTSSDIAITPNTTTGGNSSIFLSEDNDLTYGMRIQYNGEDNWLYFLGDAGSGEVKQVSIKRNGNDASLDSGSGYMVIGQEQDKNIVIDNNEIIARNNGAGSTLFLARELGSSVTVGEASIPSGYKLSVDGKIICEEVRVQTSGSWPDYVFAKDYNLMSLIELEKFILQHQHLPGVSPANEIEEEGIKVAEISHVLMEKVEELTLYIIEANKKIIELESKIDELSK